MARRLCNTLSFSPLQYALLEKDGCLEASSLLHAILRKSHDEMTPVSMAFLDLVKAFDIISHEAILEAAKVGGIPKPMLNYLRHLYMNSTVQMGEVLSRCRRGVWQGDPMSPILFILAIDRVVKAAIPEIGVQLGGVKVDTLAYADDLILCTERPERLMDKLSGLEEALRVRGMAINIKKSAGLTIV